MLGLLKKHRVGIIAAFLVGVSSVIAHLYVQSQIYYPVVHMTFPDGLSIAAVLAETKERRVCGETNDNFLSPFRSQCTDCKIISARCERELEGVDLALWRGEPVPYPTVVASDARVAFMGPADLAKVGCDAAAATLLAKGFKAAACIAPRKPAAPKS